MINVKPKNSGDMLDTGFLREIHFLQKKQNIACA